MSSYLNPPLPNASIGKRSANSLLNGVLADHHEQVCGRPARERVSTARITSSGSASSREGFDAGPTSQGAGRPSVLNHEVRRGLQVNDDGMTPHFGSRFYSFLDLIWHFECDVG